MSNIERKSKPILGLYLVVLSSISAYIEYMTGVFLILSLVALFIYIKVVEQDLKTVLTKEYLVGFYNKYTSNKFLEKFFTTLLYLLMVILSCLIYTIYNLDITPVSETKFSAALLIGISALTASIAMTRSVYATKISDEVKSNTELSSERLELYADIKQIVELINASKTKEEEQKKLSKIATKAKFLFNDEKIDAYLNSLIKEMKIIEENINRLSYDFMSSGSLKYIINRRNKELKVLFSKYLYL